MSWNDKEEIEITCTVHQWSNTVFWDELPCSLVQIYWRCGETCRLHLQYSVGGSRFFRSIGSFTLNYTASHTAMRTSNVTYSILVLLQLLASCHVN